MKRLLLLYAGALLLFFQAGFWQWQQSQHTLWQAWQALRYDWLVFITFVDATQFTLLVLVWLVADLRRQAQPAWKKLAWFGLTLWLGVPGLLTYLALRQPAQLTQTTNPP